MEVGAGLSLAAPVIAMGLVMLAVAAAIPAGSLVRNGLIGIRTRATRASDEAWVAGHRAAYRTVRGTGWSCLAVGGLLVPLALLVDASHRAPVVLTGAGAAYLVVFVGLVLSVRRADRAARRVTSTPR